jgi:hypothetical protein
LSMRFRDFGFRVSFCHVEGCFLRVQVPAHARIEVDKDNQEVSPEQRARGRGKGRGMALVGKCSTGAGRAPWRESVCAECEQKPVRNGAAGEMVVMRCVGWTVVHRVARRQSCAVCMLPYCVMLECSVMLCFGDWSWFGDDGCVGEQARAAREEWKKKEEEVPAVVLIRGAWESHGGGKERARGSEGSARAETCVYVRVRVRVRAWV